MHSGLVVDQFILHQLLASISEPTSLWGFRVWQLAYVAYLRMPTFISACVNLYMHTLTHTLSFFPMVFKVFLVLRIFYCSKTYCYCYIFGVSFRCLSLEKTDSLLTVCYYYVTNEFQSQSTLEFAWMSWNSLLEAGAISEV